MTQATGLEQYVASKRSDVYHTKDCMYAKRIKQENLVTFNDDSQATAELYHRCKIE